MAPAVVVDVRRRLLVVMAALLLLVVVGAPASHLLAVANADSEPCAAEKAAVDADKQAILEHNSPKSPVPVPPSVGIPYNEEAAALRAKGAADRAKLESCAVARLTSNGPLPNRLPDSTRNALDQARRNTAPGWRAPNPLQKNPRNGDVVVPKDSPARPVYDATGDSPVKNFPDVPLQNQARPKVGDPDPARPGEYIGKKKDGSPAVSVDHIVPRAEVVQLPGFMELMPDNMWLVINAPLNLQWLSTPVNQAKGSKSVSDMTGVDPTWQAEQHKLQDTKRQELIDLIAQLAISQSD